MSPLPTELWTSNCGAVVVVVVGADVVVVDTGGGESVIFKNPVPEKNCFSISEYLNVSQLTPVEHVARIPNTEHQENDKNKNLESSTKILMAQLLPLTSSTNFMTNAFVARFLAAKAIFLLSDNFHELMETLRQL